MRPIFPLLLFILFLAASCSEPLTYNPPPSEAPPPPPDEPVLIDCSFETDSGSCSVGWKDINDFVKDTPPGGGQYSAEVFLGGFFENYAETTVPLTKGTHSYVFSCWVKPKPTPDSRAWGILRLYGKDGTNTPILITETYALDTSWTEHILQFSVGYVDETDSLVVRLQTPAGQSLTGSVLFDLVRVDRVY